MDVISIYSLKNLLSSINVRMRGIPAFVRIFAGINQDMPYGKFTGIFLQFVKDYYSAKVYERKLTMARTERDRARPPAPDRPAVL